MADEKPRIGDSATVAMVTVVPRVFLSMEDEVTTIEGHVVRPIYFSKDGADDKGHTIGFVHDLTLDGYKALCEACMAYNEKRNGEPDA